MAKNNTRRKKDIKSKLIAAICMLLVSSIMMVSSTYAWFTLSTAPEVSGITTTIGSNGNLEIALSPASGLGADVGDAGLSTGTDWGVKNLTWGNLVDMGYTGNQYGLADLTLAPAMLALTSGTNGYTLGTNALGTPSYGSDGRISGLDADAFIAGKADGATGFGSIDADYGVRAVGTSSGLSAQALKQKNATSSIGNYTTAAITAAANSLSADGDALAAMLVAHAQVDGTDTNDYAEYVPALVALTSNLDDCIANIDDALRASLAAAATTIEGEEAFNLAIAFIENDANSLQTLVDQAGTYGYTVPADFTAVLAERDAIADRIADAVDAAEALETYAAANPTATIPWTTTGDVPGVNTVLGDLMDVDGTITISGEPISAIKDAVDDMDVDYLLGLASNCVIELGENSGLYYDIALITGNITAKVAEVPLSASKGELNINTTLKNVIIKTTVTAGTATNDKGTYPVPALPAMKTAAGKITPAASEGGAMIDAFYGYVIDLMVRTNAADSNLLLQTLPAQRVYDESTNADTLGKGTSIAFTTTDTADLATIQNLVKSIRIVFFDPTHDDLVFGMAKVNSVNISEEETGATDDDGNAIIKYTITGYFEMCEIVENTIVTNFYEAGALKEGTDAAKLCTLTQNIPQAISALVYLDGQNVTSADVLADQDVVGALNLQFASDANLQPMDNSDLFNGTTN